MTSDERMIRDKGLAEYRAIELEQLERAERELGPSRWRAEAELSGQDNEPRPRRPILSIRS